MKKKIVILIIVVTIVMVIGSCDILNTLFGTPISIEQRIQAFKDDLNTTTRLDIYKNFHETDTEQYENIKIPAWWLIQFPIDENYEFGTLDVSGSTVTTTILSDTEYAGEPVVFQMLESETNVWYIETMTIGDFVIRLMKE